MLFKNIYYLKSIYAKNVNIFEKSALGGPITHYCNIYLDQVSKSNCIFLFFDFELVTGKLEK